jgi:hypothetical protein
VSKKVSDRVLEVFPNPRFRHHRIPNSVEIVRPDNTVVDNPNSAEIVRPDNTDADNPNNAEIVRPDNTNTEQRGTRHSSSLLAHVIFAV